MNKNSIKTVIKGLLLFCMVCFFLPYFAVSCDGNEILTLSGVDLSIGKKIEGLAEAQATDSNLLVFLLLVIPMIVFVLFLAKNALPKVKRFVLALAGSSASLIILFIVSNAVKAEMKQEGGTSVMAVSNKAGFILSVVAHIVIIVSSVYGLLALEKKNEYTLDLDRLKKE